MRPFLVCIAAVLAALLAHGAAQHDLSRFNGAQEVQWKN